MKASMLSLHTHQLPLGWGQKVIFCSLLKVVMLHIKVKWKKCRPRCKVTLWIYTQSWPLRLGLKVRYWNCADVSIFFIELSTKTYLTGVCYDLNDTVGYLRDLWDLCFVIYMFLSNNPSSGDINSSNLPCFIRVCTHSLLQ